MLIRRGLVRQPVAMRLQRCYATMVEPISARSIGGNTVESQIIHPGPVPKLRIRPFTRSTLDDNVDYVNLPLDTFPNPLHSMSTDQLSKLKIKEVNHLLDIPRRNVTELDEFILKMIELLAGRILDDPKYVSNLVTILQKHESIFEIVDKGLIDVLNKNKIKHSIYQFIKSPTSKEFRTLFFEIISDLVHIDKTLLERQELLSRYFEKLASIEKLNLVPFLLTTPFFKKIMNIFGVDNQAKAFSYFVQLNIQPKNLNDIKALKLKLEKGSEVEKFIAKTGWIDPNWNDSLRVDLPFVIKQKMLHFYCFDDLKRFTTYAIDNHDILNGKLYLTLLIEKFDLKCQNLKQANKFTNDSDPDQDLQEMLEIILSYFMEFKGTDSSISVLKYMAKNDLQIRFNTLIILMRQLRLKSNFLDALLIMNNINMDQVTSTELRTLINEIVLLIKKKYPNSPKILIGYCGSIFANGLELLNELGILGISHGSGTVGSISNLDSVQKANLDPKLSGFSMLHNTLANIYEMVLTGIEKSLILEYVSKLYELYMKQIHSGRFKDNSINDKVVNKMINFLLRTKVGGETLLFEFNDDYENYELSKKIFLEFHSHNPGIRRDQVTTSLFDMLIHVSLNQYKDYEFATKVMKISRNLQVCPTFNQICPFIFFHYQRKEYDIAEIWYKELVNKAVVVRAPPSKELFRIARELNWEVSGFVVRKLNIHRNYAMRERYEELANDPGMFVDKVSEENTEDLMTEELITGSVGALPIDYTKELTAILYDSKVNV